MVSPHQSFVYIRYGSHLGIFELVDPGRFALVGRSIIGRVDRVLNRPRKISVLLESFRFEPPRRTVAFFFWIIELKRCYSVDDQQNS
ncbi:hypothetical protein DPMN_175361 [Dreissena polymorpha]|uniref:Uncharacterized protein n=1 Tax=Dreissena polymorpha TaxID=45954 RepID=A0A9D4IH68_DREPO|nr:hypothetical protein DPMN_175361 [Dreissena polymorpha]